ncbi:MULTISPECIES: molybdopterin converting factor subunit 1 [Microbulbifer]|uniref:Molybdopterin synthase sulfur carrier subunit n=1 Tax=Microbulbifer salipaludis TaxID=187980 RepID=A0ABS3E5L3_9GAMM|nr:molybdopterin converting factor subunit 1 [Microbulbifer sp. Q7]MBN8430598.1 molybdopterin converting factor subunit 1 [Microbulbifer salipaludis]
MIRVLFFASLREQLGRDAIDWEAGQLADVSALRSALAGQDETWRKALSQPQLQVAVNQQLANLQCPVRDGDEVAFFPPVTGG